MGKSFIDTWIGESDQDKKLFAQEQFILDVTEEIWAEIEKRGWNKKQLAESLGTSKANITQLLNGSRNMTLRTLSDIAYVLDLGVKISFYNEKEQGWENSEITVDTTDVLKSEDADIIDIEKYIDGKAAA